MTPDPDPDKEQRRTVRGAPVTDDLINELATEATTGYDVPALRRRGGRRPLGSAPAEVVPVRLDPELRAALTARANADYINTSDVIRQALRAWLEYPASREQPRERIERSSLDVEAARLQREWGASSPDRDAALRHPDSLAAATTVIVVDIVGFSSKPALEQSALREALQAIVQGALAAAGAPMDAVRWQDTGDGYIITTAETTPSGLIIADFVRELQIELRSYNRVHHNSARLRLRLSLHRGQAVYSGSRWAGPAVVVGARLVDSEPIRQEILDNPAADLALIVSDALFGAVLKQQLRGLTPSDFREVVVRLKSFSGTAWLALPGQASAAITARNSATVGRLAGSSESSIDEALSSITEWDFSVSVAEKDNAWGEWVISYLQEKGYDVHLELLDLRPGRVDLEALDDAVQYSKRTIVVLSPAYLSSTDVQSAWNHAWQRDPTGLNRMMIPIRVEECQPQSVVHDIQFIDLVGLRRDEAKARFAEQIRSHGIGAHHRVTPSRQI